MDDSVECKRERKRPSDEWREWEKTEWKETCSWSVRSSCFPKYIHTHLLLILRRASPTEMCVAKIERLKREKIKSLFYLHIYFVVSVGRILSISLFDLISNSGSSSSNNSNHSKKATTTSKGLIHVQCKHVMYAALNKQTSGPIIILEKTRPRVEHMTKLTNKT